jgi:hypothetical protein
MFPARGIPCIAAAAAAAVAAADQQHVDCPEHFLMHAAWQDSMLHLAPCMAMQVWFDYENPAAASRLANSGVMSSDDDEEDDAESSDEEGEERAETSAAG